MMSKKNLKAAGIAGLIFVAMALPATAQRFNSNRNNMPPRMENNMPSRMNDERPRMHGNFHSFDLIGTVSKIDEDKKLLTIKDVDGTDHVVHISDFTRINLCDFEGRDSSKDRPNDGPKVGTIKDLKKDTTVAISIFETETKTVEAASILISEK